MEPGRKKVRKCLQCGGCCEKIALPCPVLPDQFEFEGVLVKNDFMLKHFVPVKKPTEKPNKLMRDEDFERMYYYRCDLHDAKTGKCTIYNDRPMMCRNYPQGAKPEHLYTDKCGYIRKSEAR